MILFTLVSQKTILGATLWSDLTVLNRSFPSYSAGELLWYNCYRGGWGCCCVYLLRASQRWSTLCPSCRLLDPVWQINPGPRSTLTPRDPTVRTWTQHTHCTCTYLSVRCMTARRRRCETRLLCRRARTWREGSIQSRRQREAPCSTHRRPHSWARFPWLHVKVSWVFPVKHTFLLLSDNFLKQYTTFLPYR